MQKAGVLWSDSVLSRRFLRCHVPTTGAGKGETRSSCVCVHTRVQAYRTRALVRGTTGSRQCRRTREGGERDEQGGKMKEGPQPQPQGSCPRSWVGQAGQGQTPPHLPGTRTAELGRKPSASRAQRVSSSPGRPLRCSLGTVVSGVTASHDGQLFTHREHMQKPS